MAFTRASASLIILLMNSIFAIAAKHSPEIPWMEYSTSVAGGVFTSTSIVHLIPESISNLGPKACMIAAIAYTLMVIISAITSESIDNDDQLLPDDLPLGRIPAIPVALDTMGPQPSYFPSAPVFLLYATLIFHSILESMSLGVTSGSSSFLAVFLALVGHMPFETFSLGVTLAKDNLGSFSYSIFMGLFCFLSPLAILSFSKLGASLSRSADGVIDSVSAGVFLNAGFGETSEMMLKLRSCGACAKARHLLAFSLGATWTLLVSLAA